jgi:hypothetical protein
LRNRIDKIVAEMDGTTDIGRVFLSLDARASIRDGSHYLLYGSEWMLGALGFSGHEVLRSIGVPTLLEVDLPLSWVHQAFRDALAQKLLAAWTRRICNDVDYIPIVDFTFIVHKSIPPDLVVGHSHPVVLRDPYSRASFRTGDPTCVHCRTITQR